MASFFYAPGVLDFESNFLRSRLDECGSFDDQLRPIYAQVIANNRIDVSSTEFEEIVTGQPQTKVTLDKAKHVKSIVVQLIDFDHLNKILQSYWYDPKIVNAVHYLIINLVVLDRNNPCEILARPLFKMVNNMTTGLGGFVYEVAPMESKFSLVLKTPYTVVDSEELRNESAITRLAINGLREHTPNFSVMMGNFECGPSYWGSRMICESCENIFNYTLYEFVKGVTIYDYVTDPDSDLTISELLSIIVQLQISLSIAYRQGHQFTHGDLHLDNVIIRQLGEKKLIPYKSNLFEPNATGYTYILTSVCPTVIDYGRSKIKYPLDPNKPDELTVFGDTQRDPKLPIDFEVTCERMADMYRLIKSIHAILMGSGPRKNMSSNEIIMFGNFMADYFFEPGYANTHVLLNESLFCGMPQYTALKEGKISPANFFPLLMNHFGGPIFNSFFYYMGDATEIVPSFNFENAQGKIDIIPVLHANSNSYTVSQLIQDAFPANMKTDYNNSDLIRLSKFFRFQRRDPDVELYVRSKRNDLLAIFNNSFQPIKFFAPLPHKNILIIPRVENKLDTPKWLEVFEYLKNLQLRIAYYYDLLWVYHAINLDGKVEGFALGVAYVNELIAFREYYEKNIYPDIHTINNEGLLHYQTWGGREFLIQFAKTARSMPPRIKFS